MSQDIRDFVTPTTDLLALGEPTHAEPAFGWVRNRLFGQLVEHGFRSVALETDRVAALLVNDFVQGGPGTLDEVMAEGFSHGWGERAVNRALVAWLRAYNQDRPPAHRVTFHGFDAPTENYSAPSPRRYLEHARDYLGRDLDLAAIAGDDERWSRAEAVLDPASSPGATAQARQLRAIGYDLLAALDERTPDAAWQRARIHLTAGLGLLRYHWQSAQRLDQGVRVGRLFAVRDAIMAQNLLDIRASAASQGPTLVFSHNLHLQLNPGELHLPGREAGSLIGAGAIVGALLGERYTFVAGSLGRSAPLQLGDPAPDTREGRLQSRISGWGLVALDVAADGQPRTDTATPPQAYAPLGPATLDGADAILHISDGATVDAG